MKTTFKFLMVAALVSVVSSANAQKTSQQGVTIGMDLQPILQIDMTAPDMINFVFDDKGAYREGITKNAATIIKVTSTVKWDLYAVGRSQGKSPNGTSYWDQEESFGASVNSVADLPMSMVELRQRQVNNGNNNTTATYADYSQEFSNNFRPSAANSLYVSSNGTPTPPNKYGKYIAGHSGISDDITKGYMPAGSYVSDNGIGTNFEFVMDYRILPGFPAIFPNAFSADATVSENLVASANANSVMVGGAAGNGNKAYAEPGVYTMTVQYVLLEDQ
jgi:hypothetical protein